MFSENKGVVLFAILALKFLSSGDSIIASPQQTKRSFTIADDIELRVFAGSWGVDEELLFSPDGNYFVVETEHGRRDLNRPEGSLRFYRCQDVQNYLERSNSSRPPSPIWVVNRSTYKEGRILKKWRWLPDSSGVAFLERLPAKVGDSYRLVLADLGKKTTEPLTSAFEAIDQFDVHDRQHYVYTASTLRDPVDPLIRRNTPSTVGTGLSLNQLLLPDDPRTIRYYSNRSFYLWAFVGDRRFQVKTSGAALIPQGGLALSPDNRSVVTALPVPEVPPSWEAQYPPPFPSDAYRIRAGQRSAHQYVRINLQTGSVQSLTDAPISNGSGSWAWSYASPTWSSNAKEILLPGTYLKSKIDVPSRPCIAVVDLATNTTACVEMLKAQTETGTEDGFHHVQEVRFVDGDEQRVLVRFRHFGDIYRLGTTEYQRAPDGTWRMILQTKGDPKEGRDGLEVTVNQNLNEPPLVVAKYKQESRVIWDPNPELKNVELGQASVYAWDDKQGRNWTGVLFMPQNYRSGQRYPLVIQTHGFTESRFIPSGVFPTAFAARELAGVGIAVLQVAENLSCPIVTIGEGPCVVSGYEAAINRLVSEGLVNPERIGIIGFSRTCFYVMESLTTTSLHFKAASITDGFLVGYLQYMLEIGPNEASSMIGASPFGEGLQQWLRRSPEFNLDKVNAPLLVVAAGPSGVLQMWEPYVGLRYLQKPVDLIMLDTAEHVLTNPAVRMVSQGGSVDWFRFWLQNYEDPDITKAEQYTRWRGLRKLQENSTSRPTRP